MSIQRLRTAKEGWFWIARIMYMFIAFPCALLISIPSLFMAPSLLEHRSYSTFLFFAVIWLGALIPIVIFVSGVISRRRLLKQVTAAIKDSRFFDPEPNNEIYHEGDGKYLGIDTKNGTILYVHRIRKGQLDVLALTMGDWTNREVEGNSILRLYTKHPELPRIQIGTPVAQNWYDTLGAMEYKQYSTPQPFARYVDDRLGALERDLSVHIPRFA